MATHTKNLSALPREKDPWEIIGVGTVYTQRSRSSNLPPPEEPCGWYYEVGPSETRKVLAEVEFRDVPGADYIMQSPLGDLAVRALGVDGEWSTVVYGKVRHGLMGDEDFILTAAKVAVAVASKSEAVGQQVVALEASMN